MVRTVSHVEDEETHDSSSPIESKRVDQKVNASRSKHSETEQRRRSKINERQAFFMQISNKFILVQVIQYIQFLQEKLQMYEGSCQGWSPEPAKFSPWRINSGPVESFGDQSQLDRDLSGHEDNINRFHHDNEALLSTCHRKHLFESMPGQPPQDLLLMLSN
ncbi:UNVERIFIED_CONTAM: Transcription factor BIM2 [Sesamum latifolium]|uniref:Transcription factor BIM2 n=1 Tax=Sesamum latifolium TaxID=2727402 RepID=A0AAW2Y720_9LAMI